MPKEPLFPHRPKSREPLFPHQPKGSILPQTELAPSQKAVIQPGWGYYVEVAGYLKGDFRRAKTEVPVKILELRYAGASDDVLVELEDGKRGLADIRSLKPRAESLPQTRKRKTAKPARDDVDIGTWAERDRMGIWIIDKYANETIAEWWDEDAREMFDQGFFKPGDIRHQTITGRAFEDSVLDYAESVGILAGGGGRFMAKTIPQEAYYWTAVNKDTGEIVESFTPYTSSGRALRGGKVYASRHWKSDTALVEVWRQPHRYSENLKIQPVEKSP